MKKLTVFLTCVLLVIACQSPGEGSFADDDIQTEKDSINAILDSWHKDAANADFDAYFEAMDTLSAFVGTDAAEVWSKDEFMNFCKPHFDRGSAWDFKTLERNIYFGINNDVVWFDELLNTWMGICRGSGVLEKTDGEWRIKHYVLSVAVPNEIIREVVKVKEEKDSLFIVKKEGLRK